MTQSLFVQVTQKDIDGAERYAPDCCPIAWAVRRLLKTANVSVGNARVTLCDPWHVYSAEEKAKLPRYSLPQEAQDFIDRFDGGSPVEPITFTAVLEPEEIPLGG